MNKPINNLLNMKKAINCFQQAIIENLETDSGFPFSAIDAIKWVNDEYKKSDEFRLEVSGFEEYAKKKIDAEQGEE